MCCRCSSVTSLSCPRISCCFHDQQVAVCSFRFSAGEGGHRNHQVYICTSWFLRTSERGVPGVVIVTCAALCLVLVSVSRCTLLRLVLNAHIIMDRAFFMFKSLVFVGLHAGVSLRICSRFAQSCFLVVAAFAPFRLLLGRRWRSTFGSSCWRLMPTRCAPPSLADLICSRRSLCSGHRWGRCLREHFVGPFSGRASGRLALISTLGTPRPSPPGMARPAFSMREKAR